MQRLHSVVRNGKGKTQSGAKVSVFDAGTTTLVTLFANDETTTAVNPIVTTGNGIATAKVPAGEYDIKIEYLNQSYTIQGLTFLSPISSTQTDFISGIIERPADGDYKITINVPYAGTIKNITTISTTGTCTLTGKINSTNLGGTANSVSTTENAQAHTSANTFSAGDDITLTVSSNSSCENLSFNIEFTKTLGGS